MVRVVSCGIQSVTTSSVIHLGSEDAVGVMFGDGSPHIFRGNDDLEPWTD